MIHAIQRLALILLVPLMLGANPYLNWVQEQAKRWRATDTPPPTLAAWATQNRQLRQQLLAAWGGFPESSAPLAVQQHGVLDRGEYTVEKISFQTWPGVRMTANVYVPKKPGPHPALLMVHGHWRLAKQEPTVQARCIGAVKLGFVVMAVDAFGAGERGIAPALGEYHGQMVAATLLPTGRPLSGIQVYENMRAVDYLLTRPEVDGTKIGITGASGGGNQTMYAGAFDERFQAVVPVCSVGNYQAYLGAACCLCEVVPGALQFTEEGAILGLVAPRALMVINATKDAPQFSVDAAKKSIAYARPIFALHGREEAIRHTIIDSGHDYNQPMREAMYGWMLKHLAGKGNGDPVPEPSIQTENLDDLRCYPGETRPVDFLTLPMFAEREARQLQAPPATRAAWQRLIGDTTSAAQTGSSSITTSSTASSQEFAQATRKLPPINQLPANQPTANPPTTGTRATEPVNLRFTDAMRRAFEYEPEPGLVVKVEATAPLAAGQTIALLLHDGGRAGASRSRWRPALQEANWNVLTLDLRATGEQAIRERIGRAVDHNTAEWGLWLGRPLVGQWTTDVRQLLNALANSGQQPRRVVLLGEGAMGLVALSVAALDERVDAVATLGTLASWISREPYLNQRLGTIVPGVLRDFGDIPDLAGIVGSRRLVIVGSVTPSGWPLSQDRLEAQFARLRTARTAEQLLLRATAEPRAVVAALRGTEP